MENITRFETGKTYQTRSTCNYDCIFSYEVIKRTAKFIYTQATHGKIKYEDIRRVGVKIHEGVETAMPEGKYSMCPFIKADKELV